MNPFLLSTINSNFREAKALHDQFCAEPNNFAAIANAAVIMIDSLKVGNKILSCGNGGSMADAIHFAEELSGRFRKSRKAIAALPLSDSGHISCVANDYGFDYIFSRYIEALGKPGDVLLAISTSGHSANILQAAKAASAAGMQVVSLTGKDGGELAKVANQDIRVAHFGYSDRIQEIHIQIIHSLIQCIEIGLDLQ